MTSTTQGLTTAADGEKVNSESGFAAALAAKGVEPDESTASDTSIASGLETVEPGPARGPDGKFVAKSAAATTDTPPQGADTSTEGDAFTSDDPTVAAFLAKYNGNLEEAIKGAANAQSLIGKRDEEREALSNQVAELRGLVEGLKTGVQTPAAPAVVLSDEQVEEQAANLIGSKGVVAAATEAANASINGDSRIYDTILEQWALESPIQAQRFDLDFQLWKREQTAPAPTATAPAADPYLASLKAKDEMTQTFASLQSKIGAEQYAALTAVGQDGESPLTRALATMPAAVVEMTVSDDADTRLAGLELALDRAVAGGLLAAAPAVQDTIPDSVRRKLAGAGVATAGLRPAAAAPEGGNEEQTRDSAIAAFKSAIVDAETTSVASGLTYGPQK